MLYNLDAPLGDDWGRSRLTRSKNSSDSPCQAYVGAVYVTSTISFRRSKASVEITRRTDYAIRLLLELVRSGGGPVSVRTLATSQDVPYAFARGIQRDLAAAGLVETRRGASGGVVLARDPGDISLLDVVRATQVSTSCSVCTNDPTWCSRMGGCSVHRVWREADEMMGNYLAGQSLAGLTEQERDR